MNKQLIALAVAIALAVPMAADAGLAVSGQIQAEVMQLELTDTNGASDTAIYVADGAETEAGQGGASTIALTIEQQLENALTAFGRIRFQPIPDSGAVLGQRDAYVGIKHDTYGSLAVGRIASAYKTSTADWDPFYQTALQARGNGGMSAAHNSYLDNTVEYGNSVQLAAGINPAVKVQGIVDESGADDNGISAGVNMPVGSIEIALAYLDRGPADTVSMKAGAKYTAQLSGKPVSVAAQYEDTEDSGYAGKGQILYANATMTLGQLTPVIGYGQFSADAADSDATYIAAGVLYDLGESTRLHAGYRQTDSDINSGDVTAIAGGICLKF